MTLKSVKCNYEVCVGTDVLVYKNVEGDFNFCKITDVLPTADVNAKHRSAPSYSYNNQTTYYVGCGTVTRLTHDNGRCWVKLAY